MNYEQWHRWWIDQAPTYFTDKIWRFSQPDLIDRLKIKKLDCVLELGFGYGRELFQFCKLSDQVYGLELTDWACENTLVELGKRGIKPLPRLKSYDGQHIPFPTGAFQVIYSCFVVQHLSRDHARELIKEVLRVMSYHGKALFEFFGDPAYYDGGRDVFSGDPENGGMFNNAFVRQELDDLIRSCGGKVEWIETKSVTQEWGNHWVCFSRQS